MTNYNFDNFDDYDFELLCRDLLNEEQRLDIKSDHGLKYDHILSFSSFKRGKDKGIDLYFERDQIKVIGQVKLSRGKFIDLYNSLKKKINGINECDKVKELNPTKYILMTSVPLSLLNKETLIEFFRPYILSINDIYGKEDINKLISKYNWIEKRYVKLYFNNTLVLERLLNKATIDGSSFTKEQIILQLQLFVQTSNFTKALSILESNNLLIIKGIPGVGKTTLAKMLSLYYIENGYSFIEIFELDNEIERLIDADNEKCIFYYDDFLGSNSLIISDALKNEGRLNRLLRRIAQKSNKALIMTTRTNILKNAEYNSEKLKRAFNLITKYEVDVSILSADEKKEMLNKHIKRNNLNLVFEHHDLLKEKIVSHKSFSPRLIEFITDKTNYELHKNDYKIFILESLDKPEEIWSFAYNHQISHTDRIYINHLFLFGNSCSIERFRKSFSNRLRFEAINNSYTITNSEFKKCTTTLDGTFISIKSRFNYFEYDQQMEIEFINPSIVDFLMKEIKENLILISSSIESFDEGDILWTRFNHSKKELLNIFSNEQLKRILLNKGIFKIFISIDDKTKYIKTLTSYFTAPEIESIFSTEIEEILNDSFENTTINTFCNFIKPLKDLKLAIDYIDTKDYRIVNLLFEDTTYKSEFESILELFNEYNLDFDKYLQNNENKARIRSTIETVIDDEIEQFIFERQDKIRSYTQVEELYLIAKDTFKNFISGIEYIDEIVSKKLDSYDWDHLIEYQRFKNNGEMYISS
jgi:DNA polymerase III delta prime subunit